MNPAPRSTPPARDAADRRIRVLYVVDEFVAGGAERHLLEMWRRIDRDRFEVEIACFQKAGQFVPDVEAIGWPIHELGVGTRIYDVTGGRALLRLMNRIQDFRPDVVHGYLFGPNLFAVLAGRMCGVPASVVSKRNVDAFETPRQIGVQRFTLRHATHVVAVSEQVALTVTALGVPRERVTVIPNGVDADRFAGENGALVHARAALGLSGARPVVGSVGCLAARKDYSTLLAAAALLAPRLDFELVLVGDGPERLALEEQARQLGLSDRLQFAGERPDVEMLLPAFDVFVLSSREEGIPNALLEAMAAGRAAVATRVGGTPEVMQDGETGWIVPPRSPEALARALEDALQRPDEAARRGAAARRFARESLALGPMVRRHEALYRRLLGIMEEPAH